MARQPTYILAPNFHLNPDTGPIALGNLIANPLRPQRALTTVSLTTLQSYPHIETFTNYEYSTSRETTKDVSMSVWGQFVQILSAKLSSEHRSSIHHKFTMDTLETRYFVADPTLEQIEARVMDPRVQGIMKTTNLPGFRHPVYMVTGMMIAKGFVGTQERGGARSAEVEVEGNQPAPAGQAGVGVNMAQSRNTEETDTWKAGGDVVFAYQLLKIEVKGWKRNRIEYDELTHKAAYLSSIDDDGNKEDDDNDQDADLGGVTISPLSAENLPTLGNTRKIPAIDLEMDESTITCIPAACA